MEDQPPIAFGLYKVGWKHRSTNNPPDPEEVTQAILAACKAGYRAFDSAEFYKNEKEVGDALKQSGLKRSKAIFTRRNQGPREEKSRREVRLYDLTQATRHDHNSQCHLVPNPKRPRTRADDATTHTHTRTRQVSLTRLPASRRRMLTYLTRIRDGKFEDIYSAMRDRTHKQTWVPAKEKLVPS